MKTNVLDRRFISELSIQLKNELRKKLFIDITDTGKYGFYFETLLITYSF